MCKLRFILFCTLFFWQFNVNATPLAGATQYTAKLYTEVLGRMPDQSGWNHFMNFWQSGPCNKTRLKQQGMTFFNSPEFNNLNLDNSAKVLVLYRAIMLREPDQNGYNIHLNHLNNGLSSSQLASIFYDSGEFLLRVNSICRNKGFGWFPSTSPLNLADPTSSYFSGGTGEELQNILDFAPIGSTVFIAKRAVIRVRKPIDIRDGITLATIGFPSTRYYTSMARIVRDSGSFEGNGFELIRMHGSAKVKNIWIDGRRSKFGFLHANINVKAYGGDGSTFSENKVSDTAGWSSFQIWGAAEGYPCNSSIISSNMITMYGGSHYHGWADGLSISCENAIVEKNDILDASDVAIVIFRSGNATQKSKVKYNRVLNAGNSAYGGFVVDPLKDQSGNGNYNFTGTQVFNNTIWTGPAVHIDIVISIGTKPWFGINGDYGFGAQAFGNSSGSSTTNSNNGIVVSGMHSAYVHSNTLNNNLQNSITCPTANVIADISSGNASGNIQPYQDLFIQGCMGH